MNITVTIMPRMSIDSVKIFHMEYELQMINCTKLFSLTISNQDYLYHVIVIFYMIKDVHIDVSVHKGFPLLTQYYFTISSETSRSFQQINDIFFITSLYVHFNPNGKHFMFHKMVIKYHLSRQNPISLYPSVLVRFEVFDNSKTYFPLIMNLSVGGWRIGCTNLNQKIDFNAKVLYENYGGVMMF
ncbi:hypothetical protein RF11_04901 [Thelohanellus kitauei]|uniref:Uncharacterized protein n=1 Tax=Thelohanellus kitauei TaxID=669202 RepID=A0A0C2MG00_THEKT|nr:hypothetical protein RF11_04901 [Thelohanellus kitauei]